MSKLLDGIINTIFGPDTSAMSEADAAKTEKQRSTDRQECSESSVQSPERSRRVVHRRQRSSRSWGLQERLA
jgi:hypothetical protein